MSKRVVCLYRASTKQQVDHADPKHDLPLQELRCRQFAKSKGWTIIKEFNELGVSGYKVRADKRDAVQVIRQWAEKKAFDILLVFMFDRIGRIADESPFVVEWLVRAGIEVWSVEEGQEKLETREDKLMNYIRFWQAEGESVKTSIRVKARHQQITSEGIWRGGAIPFGYKTEHQGRFGKKKKPLLDLVKNPEEGPLVEMIFEYTTYRGYGCQRLANHLNESFPGSGRKWCARTVRSMISNPMYTGRLRCGEILSEPIEELRYISDALFETCQRAIKRRITRKHPEMRNEENKAVPDGSTKTSVYGATLLNGILCCGHCGGKLHGTYHTKTYKRKDGTQNAYHRPVYRCFNHAEKKRDCDGPMTYSGMKVDEAVMRAVRSYFSYFKNDVDKAWSEQIKRQMRRKNAHESEKHQQRLETLERELNALNEEIVKSIMGASAFEPDRLRDMITVKEQAVIECKEAISKAKASEEDADMKLKEMTRHVADIRDWADTFDEMDVDEKRMVLAHMIQRITIRDGYFLTIYFYLSTEDFTETIAASQREGYNVEIQEGTLQSMIG